jgi:hypothetical protein
MENRLVHPESICRIHINHEQHLKDELVYILEVELYLIDFLFASV